MTRLEAFAVHRGTDFAFSHTTAARLFGVPLPAGSSDLIHVSVPADCRAPVVRGFVGHKLTRWQRVEVSGLPTTSAEQTWLDLATILNHEDLVIAGDFLVGGRRPLADLTLLRAALEASPGRRGAKRAGRALEHIRVGSESPGETRLRLIVCGAGLPEPLLNYNIVDHAGHFVARADLVYPAARIALEYEGDVHRVDQDTWRRDITRRERVEDLGWRMVRITAGDLRESQQLIARIRRLLRIR